MPPECCSLVWGDAVTPSGTLCRPPPPPRRSQPGSWLGAGGENPQIFLPSCPSPWTAALPPGPPLWGGGRSPKPPGAAATGPPQVRAPGSPISARQHRPSPLGSPWTPGGVWAVPTGGDALTEGVGGRRGIPKLECSPCTPFSQISAGHPGEDIKRDPQRYHPRSGVPSSTRRCPPGTRRG